MRLRLLSGVAALLAIGAASAQEPLVLDDTCTVTVGNQTALVRPDGSFLVRNIPIFQPVGVPFDGKVPNLLRARATCLRGGEMITGQSVYFSVDPGETAFVVDVFPTELDPIPVGIALQGPSEPMLPTSTFQVTVTATLPDGSTEDVTARAAGTTYLSTNPDVVGVTREGLLVATNNRFETRTGRVLAINEGNLTAIRVSVLGNDSDIDDDGLPNFYEDLYGLDRFNPLDAQGDLDLDGLTNLEEFLLGTLPNHPDTDLDGLPDGVDPDPLRADLLPPEVTVVFPTAETKLVEGETIEIRAVAQDDLQLAGGELFVNGVSWSRFRRTGTIAFLTGTFTVPYGATSLRFGASASDSYGTEVRGEDVVVAVVGDPLTTILGTVVDAARGPVAGADVTLELHGLEAEFFDFDVPLDDFPDLTGRTPEVTRLISAVNLRNPDDLLSADTFGVAMTPDFAARLRGLLAVPAPGTYTFVLGADDGARLTVDGVRVVEVVGDGEFAEATGSIALAAEDVAIEIEYFQAVGDAELQLSLLGFDGTRTVVPTPDLRQSSASFTATTGADGSFAFPDIPSILGEVAVAATAVIDGAEHRGSSQKVPVVRGGVTDVGEVVVRGGLNVLLLDEQCDSVSYFPTAMENLGLQGFTVVARDAELATQMSGGTTWDVVIVDNFLDTLSASAPLIQSYIENGGRVFMAYWNWSEELAASFEADLFFNHLTSREIFLWEPDAPLLTEPNQLRKLNARSFTACPRNDSNFNPIGDGVALAGSTVEPRDRTARLILGNGGRTILFGSKPGLYQADHTLNGQPDGLDLAENVVTFLVQGPAP